MQILKYKINHKYVLCEGFEIDLAGFGFEYAFNGIEPEWFENFLTDRSVSYVATNRRFTLSVAKGFKWDGASGPTIDTENTARAAFVHDALYRLMRNGKLSPSYRKSADIAFRNILIHDGTSKFRAWLWYFGVRIGGKSSAMPDDGGMAVCVN